MTMKTTIKITNFIDWTDFLVIIKFKYQLYQIHNQLVLKKTYTISNAETEALFNTDKNPRDKLPLIQFGS